MAATKIAASIGVSSRRNGRNAGLGSACPITSRSIRSSHLLPRGAFLGILYNNAHRCQFITDAIGFLEVLAGAGGGALNDECINQFLIRNDTPRIVVEIFLLRSF